MDAGHQYAAHLLGLFLICGALSTHGSVHPAVWMGALGLVGVPVLFELEALRR